MALDDNNDGTRGDNTLLSLTMGIIYRQNCDWDVVTYDRSSTGEGFRVKVAHHTYIQGQREDVCVGCVCV